MDSSIASMPRKVKKIKNLKDMERRLVILLRKEQIRLIVSKKYVIGTDEEALLKDSSSDVNRGAKGNANVCEDTVKTMYKYNFEKVVTSQEQLENTALEALPDQIEFDMSVEDYPDVAQAKQVHRSNSGIVGALRSKSPNVSARPSTLIRRTSAADIRSDGPATSMMRPKEYRCIVRYTTTEFSWAGPVECGELLAIVRHLRDMNSKLNKLYRHWQARLEYLVEIQQQYVRNQREFFEWCILRVLIELIEGISSQVAPFHILYTQFQKLYKQKSYRNSATFSQITNRLEDSNTVSHFVVNAPGLKAVIDEYLEDIRNDFERLQNLVTGRRLMKDFETSIRIARSMITTRPPWKATQSEADVTIRSSCVESLAIRAGKILPWVKLLKKTLALHELDEERSRQLMKLRKKATKLEIKIQKMKKPRVKIRKALLRVEHAHNVKASDIEYRYWMQKMRLERRFEWKYYIRNYRGAKYQAGWVTSRRRIDNAIKIFFGGRKLALKLRLAWEIKVLKEGLPYPLLNDSDNPPLVEETPEQMCNDVSIEDLWNANIRAPAFLFNECGSETDTATEVTVTVLETRPLLSTFSDTKPQPSLAPDIRPPISHPLETVQSDKPEDDMDGDVSTKLLQAINTIQEAGREITTSFQKISEQHAIISKQIETINLYTQSLNFGSLGSLSSRPSQGSQGGVSIEAAAANNAPCLFDTASASSGLPNTDESSNNLPLADEGFSGSLDGIVASTIDELITASFNLSDYSDDEGSDTIGMPEEIDIDALLAQVPVTNTSTASDTSVAGTCILCTDDDELRAADAAIATSDENGPSSTIVPAPISRDEESLSLVSTQENSGELLETSDDFELVDQDQEEALEVGQSKFRPVWD